MVHEPLDEAARYRLLADVVAQRALAVAATDGPVYTDGSLVAVDARAPRDVVRAQVVLHASLLAAGSLDRAIMRRLTTRPTATSRYLLLEGARLRDTVLSTQLPGILKALAGPHVPVCDGPQSSLRVALSSQCLPPTPEAWGVIRPSRLWKAPPLESKQLATPSAAARFVSSEDDLDDEPEAPRLYDRLFGGPAAENSPLSRMLRRVFTGRTSTGRSPANRASAAEYSRSRALRSAGTVATRLALPALPGPAPASPDAAAVVGWYPEWEAAKNRYLARWCRVVEVPTTVPSVSSARVPLADRRFRRQLARIGLRPQPRRRQPAGQDLDLDSVIRYRIDCAVGADPGDRIWVDRRLARCDLAVLVLLDASGSAAEGAGRTVLTQHTAVAAATVDSLHSLGARTAAVSFNGRGRTLVRCTRLKHFGEAGTARFRARIGAVKPGGYTRLGAMIRHSTTMLKREGCAERHLLVILSDGFPYDDGYESRYAMHDTQRAINEALLSGIGCLCLSYSNDPPAAFERATRATFDDLTDLEPRIGNLFHDALSSADLRRRLTPSRHQPQPGHAQRRYT